MNNLELICGIMRMEMKKYDLIKMVSPNLLTLKNNSIVKSYLYQALNFSYLCIFFYLLNSHRILVSQVIIIMYLMRKLLSLT